MKIGRWVVTLSLRFQSSLFPHRYPLIISWISFGNLASSIMDRVYICFVDGVTGGEFLCVPYVFPEVSPQPGEIRTNFLSFLFRYLGIRFADLYSLVFAAAISWERIPFSGEKEVPEPPVVKTLVCFS